MNHRPKMINAFVYALNGIRESYRTQLNFRIHMIATILVAAMGFWLNISALEWAILMITIMVVVMCEQINTALEYFVDFISPEYHPMAGKVKDISAGAVLITAIGACVTGGIIFLPKLWRLIQ